MRRPLPVLALVLLAACGLPVNEDPEFYSPAEADLNPDDLVIGFELDGVARAYPMATMATLEIVNDQIGERPIAITWCPLSASAAVFERAIDGRVLTFRFHPDLFKFNLIIEDTDTGTQWSQLARAAIDGPMNATPLKLLPSLQTTWGYWSRLHPDSLVMQPLRGSHRFDYQSSGEPGTDGLGPKSLVHVVWVNGEARAYPLEELATLGHPLTDEIERVQVTVYYSPDGPTASVTADDGSPLPGITLYREYIPEFYPTARMWRSSSAKSTSPAGTMP